MHMSQKASSQRKRPSVDDRQLLSDEFFNYIPREGIEW
jgi:hypothetical protein